MRNKILITLALLLVLPTISRAEFETFRHKRTNKIIWANIPSEPSVSAASVADADDRDDDQNADDTKPVDLAATKAKEFVDRYSRMLNVRDGELKYWNTRKDNLGISHTVFGQEYQYNTSVKNKSKAKTIPIFGGQFDVHSRLDGSVKNVGGYTGNIRRLSPRTKISKKFAKALAVQMWRESFKTQRTPKIGRVEKVVLVPELLRSDNQNPDEAYLVWKVEVFREVPGQSWAFFVDAQSGMERGQRVPLDEGLTRWIANCSYDATGFACARGLDNPNDGFDYVYGYRDDMPRNGQPLCGPNPRYLPQLSLDDDRTYEIIGQIHSLIQAKWGINGANNLGGIGNSTTYPAGVTTIQTYTDWYPAAAGACPTAQFYHTGSIVICAGMAVPDVLAHEYAHALLFFAHKDANQNAIGMHGLGEARALNENHSDVFGEYFEHEFSGQCDWKHGTQSALETQHDFADPYQGPRGTLGAPNPDRYYSSDIVCDDAVPSTFSAYANMQIFNKAFYLSANGGRFNGCTISGIGIDKATQVWTNAAKFLYSYNETFNGAYHKINASCAEIYGEPSLECASVKSALQAAEVDQGGKCSSILASIPSCIDEIGW